MPETTTSREMRLADDVAWVRLHLRHASTTLLEAVDRARGDQNLTQEVEDADKLLTELAKVLQTAVTLALDLPDARMPRGTQLHDIRHEGCEQCGEMAYEAAHTLLNGTGTGAKAYSGDMAHWAEVHRG